MKRNRLLLLLFLIGVLTIQTTLGQQNYLLDVRDFGAVDDGKVLDTEAIQEAIVSGRAQILGSISCGHEKQ